MAVPAVTTSPGSAARVITVPSKGAVTIRSLRLSSASASWNRACCAAALADAISARCCSICLRTVVGLERANAGIGKIGLGRGQRSPRGFETALADPAAPGGGYGGRLLIRGGRRLLALALGDRAGLHQLLIGVVIELRQLEGRFLLREVGFGGGHVGFGGGDITFRLPRGRRIHFGLFGHQLVLLQLLFVNRNLVAGRFRPGIGAGERGARLIFARPHLRVVENGDGVAGFDSVAFAHADFDNAPGRFGRRRPNRRLRCARSASQCCRERAGLAK